MPAFISGAVNLKRYTPYEALKFIAEQPLKSEFPETFILVFITQEGTPAYLQRYKTEGQYRSGRLKKLRATIHQIECTLDETYQFRSTAMARAALRGSQNGDIPDRPLKRDLLLAAFELADGRISHDLYHNHRHLCHRYHKGRKLLQLITLIELLRNNGLSWTPRFDDLKLCELTPRNRATNKIISSYIRRVLRCLESIADKGICALCIQKLNA